MELIVYSNLKSRYKIWSCFLEINNFKIINEEKFNNFKINENSCEIQIQKDIFRTLMPKNLNNSQKIIYSVSLSNILRAYSNDNTEIGYIQGMNMVASAILFNLYSNINNIEKVEYDAYKIFYCLLDKYNIIQIYQNQMKNLFQIVEKLENIVKKNLNNVYLKLETLNLGFFVLFNSHYLSILWELLPLEQTYIIIDLFLIYGFNIITNLLFLMLKIYKEKILNYKSTEELMIFIRNSMIKEFFDNFKTYSLLLYEDLKIKLI